MATLFTSFAFKRTRSVMIGRASHLIKKASDLSVSIALHAPTDSVRTSLLSSRRHSHSR